MRAPEFIPIPNESAAVLLARKVIKMSSELGDAEWPDQTRHVPMDSMGYVRLPKGVAGRIYTDGLCGCTAVSVTTVTADGNRHAYVQHYSPGSRDQGIQNLQEYASKLAALPVAGTIEVTIMTPGEPDFLNPAETVEEDPRYTLEAAALLDSLHNESRLKTLLYNKRVDFNVYENGRALGVNIGDIGPGQITTT